MTKSSAWPGTGRDTRTHTRLCGEIEYFREHYAFRYIRRGMLEIEVKLIGDLQMTHPDDEHEWEDIRRRRELERRIELIDELQDVEHPSFQEMLVFGTIRIGKAMYAAASKTGRWMFRLASRQARP